MYGLSGDHVGGRLNEKTPLGFGIWDCSERMVSVTRDPDFVGKNTRARS